MGLTVTDSYYLKAKAAANGFCDNWEEACEALNYALSYDENHCASLCLLGKIQAEHLIDYDSAFACFDKVIAIDSTYEEVYGLYAKYLMWANEKKRAKKLINYAFTIKTTSKAELYWLSSYLEETKEHYKKCLLLLKKAKKHSYNNGYFDYMKDEEQRIKNKQKLNKKKSAKKKTKDKTRKKKKKK